MAETLVEMVFTSVPSAAVHQTNIDQYSGDILERVGAVVKRVKAGVRDRVCEVVERLGDQML